ncbi:hypothetical protein [Anaeromyxobacter oryzisoli]|uniref:hypothetical protein n=1 Tax=Anaeromyxobacter oryzisoli TaxID=2925408 RepID=UPI001F55DF4A|nr:hypothetical protein [Anaeromyxobacter sp. SG63]
MAVVHLAVADDRVERPAGTARRTEAEEGGEATENWVSRRTLSVDFGGDSASHECGPGSRGAEAYQSMPEALKELPGRSAPKRDAAIGDSAVEILLRARA